MRFRFSDVDCKIVGATGEHVRLVFTNYADFVAMSWSSADKVESLEDDDVLELTGSLSWNYFNDRWSVNLICNKLEVVS